MPDPFQPPPPPPSGQPPVFAQSPAGYQQGYPPGYLQPPPPPPARSGGCFKGCCIVAVIVGVLGIIGAIVIAMNWQKWMVAAMMKGAIEPSDLTADEKGEAKELLQKYFEAAMAQKINQNDFQTEMNRLGAVGNDGKSEAKELRPIFGRIKSQLKTAGYPFPSALFPLIVESSTQAEGDWEVVVTEVPSGKKSEAAAVVSKATKVPEDTAKTMLKELPVTVMSHVAQAQAEALVQELEAAGCEAEARHVTK